MSSEPVAVGLIIKNLTVEEAHDVAELIREFSMKDPTKNINILVDIPGKTVAELQEIIKKIFTPPGVAM